MQLQCPCCGEQFPFEAGFADADGKTLAALFAPLDPKLGRAILNYLRLFSPAKRGLRMTKAIKVVEELVGLVESGQVQRDARTADPAQAQAAAPAKPSRKASTPQQDIQEQVGRIQADMLLELIKPDEGERQIKALRGE